MTIIKANEMGLDILGTTSEKVLGMPCNSCFHFNKEHICPLTDPSLERTDGEYSLTRKNGDIIPVSMTTVKVTIDGKLHVLAMLADITEQKMADKDQQKRQVQDHHNQKMTSIGELAAGIAHEINTPTQYVGDNTRFLQDSFSDLTDVIRKFELLLAAEKQGNVTTEMVTELENACATADLEYLYEEIPKAIEQSLEGTSRVAAIVRAMKEFSHPGTVEKTPTDINKALETTITISRNEWKYVSEVETNFDPSLPVIQCLPGDLNQGFLNLITNAAHAVGSKLGEDSDEKGTITISTSQVDNYVEVRISDTGTGIPEEIRQRIFDPFFTTKDVGKGTGQGLTIAYDIIVNKHDGILALETEDGVGTTFIIQLPVETEMPTEEEGQEENN